MIVSELFLHMSTLKKIDKSSFAHRYTETPQYLFSRCEGPSPWPLCRLLGVGYRQLTEGRIREI